MVPDNGKRHTDHRRRVAPDESLRRVPITGSYPGQQQVVEEPGALHYTRVATTEIAESLAAPNP
jgi:hypothetical protein